VPTYVYRCPNEHEIEIIRAREERNTPAVCGQCGREMKRSFSVPVIIFKGNGFYTTDKKE